MTQEDCCSAQPVISCARLGKDGAMDALASRLAAGGVRGTVMAHVLAGDTWAIGITRRRDAVFHGVTAGTCWLRLDDRSPLQLFAGDVVLLPGGAEHVLASAPRGPATPLDL